jgi:hypothetical protein
MKTKLTLFVTVLAVALFGVGCGLAKAKKRAQEIKCHNNLKTIEMAKDSWSIENNATDGAAVTLDDIKEMLGKGPECAASGKYQLGAVGESPSCSIDIFHSQRTLVPCPTFP